MTPDWIRESNLIEDVDEPAEDSRSRRAWAWLKTQDRLTDLVILRLHRKIMRVKLGARAGTWRLCNVWVGGRECPGHTLIPKLMDYWLTLHGDPDFLLVDAKEAHIAFEHIHPFIDGNGRTGRMLMNWHRLRNGKPPLCIKAAERWDYYKWFDEKTS